MACSCCNLSSLNPLRDRLLWLDGENCIKIKNTSNYDSPNFTVEFWAFTSRSVEEACDILAFPSVPNFRLALSVNYLAYFKGNTFEWYRPALRANRWYHIAVICEGRNVSVWLNGECKFQVSLEDDNGRSLIKGGFVIGDKFSGFIKHLRVWNMAIGAEQLDKRMEEAKASRDPLIPTIFNPNVIGYWPLIDNVRDLSGGDYIAPLTLELLSGAEWSVFFDKQFCSSKTDAFRSEFAPLVTPNKTVVWEGRKVTFKDIEINGIKSPVIYVLEGQEDRQFTFRCNLQTQWSYSSSDYCPGCVVQIYIGIRNVFSKGIIEHYYSGIEKSISFEFTAENLIRGTYLMTQTIDLMYNFREDRTHHNNLGSTMAVIHVLPQLWSPLNHAYLPFPIRKDVQSLRVVCKVKGIPLDLFYQIAHCLIHSYL